jgi:hypothetical protein
LAGNDEEKSFSLSQEFSSDVARLSGVSYALDLGRGVLAV